MLTFTEIRKICHERLDARRRAGDDDRETLSTCPECKGVGQIQLSNASGRRYRMVCCPWCDGNCVTDSYMIALWKDYKEKRLV